MMLWAFASGPAKRSPWCHKVDADRPDRKDDLPSVEICFKITFAIGPSADLDPGGGKAAHG